MDDGKENPWEEEQEPSPRLISEGLIYRLPIYLLLSSSILACTIDSSLRPASGGDESIYIDATIRFDTSSLLGPVIATGSLLLVVALGFFVVECIHKRRFDSRSAIAIGLGILAHPWVIGWLLERMFLGS